MMSTAADAANHTIATAWQAVLGEKRSQELAPGEAGYYGVELHGVIALLITPDGH